MTPPVLRPSSPDFDEHDINTATELMALKVRHENLAGWVKDVDKKLDAVLSHVEQGKGERRILVGLISIAIGLGLVQLAAHTLAPTIIPPAQAGQHP